MKTKSLGPLTAVVHQTKRLSSVGISEKSGGKFGNKYNNRFHVKVIAA